MPIFRHQISELSSIKNLLFSFQDFLFCFVFVFVYYLLNINHHILRQRPLMNYHRWVEHQLLLHRVIVWINRDCCVCIKVWLMNLHLLKRCLKESYHTQRTRTYCVTHHASYKLLGIRGHLGLGLGILGRACLLLTCGATSIQPIIHFNFFPIGCFGPYIMGHLDKEKTHHPRGQWGRMKNWFLFFSIFSFFLSFSSHAFFLFFLRFQIFSLFLGSLWSPWGH